MRLLAVGRRSAPIRPLQPRQVPALSRHGSLPPIKPQRTPSVSPNLPRSGAASLPEEHIHHPNGAKNIRLTFRLFLDHLAQKQRDALAQITITSTFCFLKYNKRQLARLKGLRTLHIIQEHRPNLGSMYDEISYGWKHAGGFPRSLRGVKLRRLQSVRFSLALRSPKHKRTASSEDAIVRAQTSALTRLLRLVEARLFYSLAGRPMPLAISEEREENGDCFEERLRSLRRSRSSTALR
jgi:hypothetical protein